MLDRTLAPTRRSALVLALAFGLLLPLVASVAHAGERVLPQIEWSTQLKKFQIDNDKFVGQRFSAECLPSSYGSGDTEVWGTDVYTSTSSLCAAAAHAGIVGTDGGPITVEIRTGAASYEGSERHGVTSASLPATDRSIVFVADDSSAQKSVPKIDWDTKFTATGLAYRDLVGQQFTFDCLPAPGNLTPRRIVGTDSYAFHSMICRAAVHAGTLTTDGGLVTVQLDSGPKKLVGSTRHGVESHDGPGGDRTISFVHGG